MSTLEKSVHRLAGALDALEAKLEDRIADLAAKTETVEQARVKARTAKTQAAAAAEDLADAIRDLKSLIATGSGG
jgi:phage-related minor tail protein